MKNLTTSIFAAIAVSLAISAAGSTAHASLPIDGKNYSCQVSYQGEAFPAFLERRLFPHSEGFTSVSTRFMMGYQLMISLREHNPGLDLTLLPQIESLRRAGKVTRLPNLTAFGLVSMDQQKLVSAEINFDSNLNFSAKLMRAGKLIAQFSGDCR